MRIAPLILVVAFALSLTPRAAAVEHPFILWTPAEAAAIRERLANDPDAELQLEKMKSWSAANANPTVWNLFRYVVLEEEEAGQREKNALLKFIGRKPDPMTWDVDPKTLKWNVGMPSSGDSHMRDEQTLNTLRYDCLYHLLSDEERKGVEEALRSYIAFHLDGHKPWHPDFRYDRTSWLPNMHWPRAIGTHLMAAALGDEALVKRMHESQGGWKWFFDGYIADGKLGGFYMEEFGKYYSNIGTMLMYCEALRKLGLDRYGWGYTGAGGATMRGFLSLYIRTGLPRLAAPEGGTPRYPRVTMGDAGDLHTTITGYGWPGRKGRLTKGPAPFWRASRMNGPLPKMREPGWFEIGHARFPEDGYDYFLAQMRAPGEERYLPSLYWNLKPIDPEAAKPPPAPSYVTRERGFALLRADESPTYWEGPAPAVSFQFGMYYVHYVHDCFALLQYVAHNRLLYCKMGRPPKRRGYAGGDDWKDHVRGHCGVVVDGLKAKPVDRGNAGCENQRIREDLDGPAKFAACRASGIYPGVDQERAMVLTDEYLFDVFRLVSAKEAQRVFDWQVLAYGKTADRGGEGWTPVADWQGPDAKRIHLVESRVLDAKDATWEATVLLPDRGESKGVGVTVRMLGEAGTTLIDSQPPGFGPDFATSLLATRTGQKTVFAALHAPFAGGAENCPVTTYERINEDDRGIAVKVAGPALDDRVLVAYGDDIEAPRSYATKAEAFTFTGYALVRITAEQVTVQGDLAELKVAVTGTPKLVVNGEDVEAAIADGGMTWTR